GGDGRDARRGDRRAGGDELLLGAAGFWGGGGGGDDGPAVGLRGQPADGRVLPGELVALALARLELVLIGGPGGGVRRERGDLGSQRALGVVERVDLLLQLVQLPVDVVGGVPAPVLQVRLGEVVRASGRACGGRGLASDVEDGGVRRDGHVDLLGQRPRAELAVHQLPGERRDRRRLYDLGLGVEVHVGIVGAAARHHVRLIGGRGDHGHGCRGGVRLGGDRQVAERRDQADDRTGQHDPPPAAEHAYVVSPPQRGRPLDGIHAAGLLTVLTHHLPSGAWR